ncbi:low-density lipoprotein receptor-related protein 1B-like [Dendronephthya gigantea]|uniref:low-density lipoprotein receptor-related protein 1B-like n=1 Tax=Dendronephthya gigantea TaxID=151771 RepID=UPI00106AF4FE|nr:low-density lipoprotein receptor-related protein 1B-like [Dendronephthya gigantea]
MYSLVQMQISRTMISLIFLMYIGGVLVNCNDDIPFCRKHLKKLKEEIRDWRERCLNESRHEIISSSCGAEKEYYKERMRTHSKMCFYAGPYPEPYLLVRLPAEIVATDLESLDTTVLIRGLKHSAFKYGLEFDYMEKKIYFTEARHIYRMNFEGGNKEIFVENTDPVDIAIDWKGRRIFWITSKNQRRKIMVMSLDRGNTIAKVFVDNEWMTCLEIDSAAGYIFWANFHNSNDLRQRHLVGNNNIRDYTIYQGFYLEFVKDIALDYQKRIVYVTTGKNRLVAINYTNEVIGSGYRYPVDIYETLIYFQKKKSPADNIMEMNLVNRNISRYITLPKNSVPKRFIVVHKS